MVTSSKNQIVTEKKNCTKFGCSSMTKQLIFVLFKEHVLWIKSNRLENIKSRGYSHTWYYSNYVYLR